MELTKHGVSFPEYDDCNCVLPEHVCNTCREKAREVYWRDWWMEYENSNLDLIQDLDNYVIVKIESETGKDRPDRE